jgi:1-phosphofructokinase family hexose kinase
MLLIVGENLAWQKVCLLPRLVGGEVNRITHVHAFGAGKGQTVARALAGIRGEGEVIGYAGGSNGRLAEESLRGEGIRCAMVRIAAETRVCTTLAEPDGTSTELIEPSPVVTPGERDELRRLCLERLGNARLLILSGTTVKGESDDCYSVLVREAHARGVVTLVDSVCPEARRALEERPAVLKINARELGELAGQPVGTLAERVSACRTLMKKFATRWILVSQGPQGIEAFDGRVLLHAVPPKMSVVNVIGSGDAAAAGAGWAVHEMRKRLGDDEIFGSPVCLREALLSAAAMGTANCLNATSGKVVHEDYLAVRERTQVLELSLP